MMKKIFAASTLFIALFCLSFQMNETDLAHWDKKIKLNWDDYKGKFNEKDTLPVKSFVLLDFQYQIKGDSLFMTLRNVLVRKNSWLNPSAKSKELLANEQAYFDIAEIHTRRMRKLLYTGKIPYNAANVTVSSYYRTTIKDRNYEQAKFRNETNYGKNKAKLTEWQAKIKKELLDLDQWNAEKVHIKLIR